MLIFTDSHRKYLTKAELSNLEKPEPVIDQEFSNASMLGLSGGRLSPDDVMGATVAPEYQVPGPGVYLQPHAMAPTGGTETSWDKTEWILHTLNLATQKVDNSAPLPLDRFASKKVSKGAGKEYFRTHGYAFHSKRATFINFEIEMNAGTTDSLGWATVYRTALIKNAMNKARNISFFVTTNHNRWVQGSASINNVSTTRPLWSVSATGLFHLHNLTNPSKHAVVSSLLENGQTVQTQPGSHIRDWDAGHGTFPVKQGQHQVWNPRYPGIVGHGWPVRKHTFSAEKNSTYKLIYSAGVVGNCTGANNSIEVRLEEAPALFVI